MYRILGDGARHSYGLVVVADDSARPASIAISLLEEFDRSSGRRSALVSLSAEVAEAAADDVCEALRFWSPRVREGWRRDGEIVVAEDAIEAAWFVAAAGRSRISLQLRDPQRLLSILLALRGDANAAVERHMRAPVAPAA
jgi:histidinol dehydrogenase